MSNGLKILSALLATAAGTPVWAGAKETAPVTVAKAKHAAEGALGDARSSADARQFIGCFVYASTGQPAHIHCTATDAAGATLTCDSTEPGFVAAAQAVGTDSFLEFRTDAAGKCISIGVSNNSATAPKPH